MRFKRKSAKDSRAASDGSPTTRPRSLTVARREMEVNYFGMLNMVRAFVPSMRRRRAGIIVNIVSMVSHMNRPASGSYSASKAAALSLTQGIRTELAGSGLRVCGIFPGAVDTPMSSHISGPKTSAAEVAKEVLNAVRDDDSEDRYIGARSIELFKTHLMGLKALERRFRGA